MVSAPHLKFERCLIGQNSPRRFFSKEGRGEAVFSNLFLRKTNGNCTFAIKSRTDSYCFLLKHVTCMRMIMFESKTFDFATRFLWCDKAISVDNRCKRRMTKWGWKMWIENYVRVIKSRWGKINQDVLLATVDFQCFR